MCKILNGMPMICAPLVISPFLLNYKLYELNLNRSLIVSSSTIEKFVAMRTLREHHRQIFLISRWIANRKVSWNIVREDV